jgi:sialate O-acetylesterase
LFADHVVLQTIDDFGPGATISGTGTSEEHINLRVSDSDGNLEFKSDSQVDVNGSWSLSVNMTSGGPYTLTLTGSISKEILTVHDAHVGDVYLCSGQSNMVFPIGAGNDYEHHSGPHSIENASQELRAASASLNMRLWFVPSPSSGFIAVDPASELGQRDYVQRDGFKIYVGASDTPQTNLTGSCNTTAMCHNLFDKEKGVCDTDCHSKDGNLAHEWIPITTESVGALSAVCYMTLRNVKLEATPNRAVGIVASYVGGTPVGCWTNDANADAACDVKPGTPGANVPCDPASACCPQKLYNDKISPLLPFRIRAALWYQGELDRVYSCVLELDACVFVCAGEANSDEGYARTREQYACQMKLLITTWREAWGYDLPFFFVQLHGWGGAGGASQYPYDAVTQVRLGQDDAASRMGLTGVGMASAVDGCEADTNPAGSIVGPTCNLHPGFKTQISTRLGWEVLGTIFGKTKPQRPRFKAATYNVSATAGNNAQRVTVEFEIENAEGLSFKNIHDYEKIWDKKGCAGIGGGLGMVGLNVTLDGSTQYQLINGTATIGADGMMVGTWSSPYFGDHGIVGTHIGNISDVRYLCTRVPTCVVENAANRPLGPFIHPFE